MGLTIFNNFSNNYFKFLSKFKFNYIVKYKDFRKIINNFKYSIFKIYNNKAENDKLNYFIISAQFNCDYLLIIRIYTRYIYYKNYKYTKEYILNIFINNPYLVNIIIFNFNEKFKKKNVNIFKIYLQLIKNNLFTNNKKIIKILKIYLQLIKNTLCTNFYKLKNKNYISIKINNLNYDIPYKKKILEIFVYSYKMEGFHLRGSLIARGGIRWSDRYDDLYTEILGLFKSQLIKNAIIVPDGAKGGFICKQIWYIKDKNLIKKEAIACYKIFIKGMLDITDNYLNDNKNSLNEKDYYLVVAADKGTATFSNIANKISQKYNFWLGDAFASGGKYGYDHKKLAITSRGAWESVKNHFRMLNFDINKLFITVIGIGDMSGDVFGNGMLLSKNIYLLGAFNHKYIFIDPYPDAKISFFERKRLFNKNLDWDKYNIKIISKGGGVFNRSDKFIFVNEIMSKRFNILVGNTYTNEIIKILLRCKVNLLWNGGIGTYIKASDETHTEVNDKLNDNVRINGNELRASVVGEGGNLGITQRGRYEAANNKVLLNTDFIDNAGGVNCSDHEVNIKLLLNYFVNNGELLFSTRNILLRQMKEEVINLVLNDNYLQIRALTFSLFQSKYNLDNFIQFIIKIKKKIKCNIIEYNNLLYRNNNILYHNKIKLTNPEVSILISYSKIDLKINLKKFFLNNDLIYDKYINDFIKSAFPKKLINNYSINNHYLKNNILITQIANDLINHMGIFYVNQTLINNINFNKIIFAYILTKNVFNLKQIWEDIKKIINLNKQMDLILLLLKFLYRLNRWFIMFYNYKNLQNSINKITLNINLLPNIIINHNFLYINEYNKLQKYKINFIISGIPINLINKIFKLNDYIHILNIIKIVNITNINIKYVYKLYLIIEKIFNFSFFIYQIDDVTNNYKNYKFRTKINEKIYYNIIKNIIYINKKIIIYFKNKSLNLIYNYIIKNIYFLKWNKIIFKLKYCKEYNYKMKNIIKANKIFNYIKYV